MIHDAPADVCGVAVAREKKDAPNISTSDQTHTLTPSGISRLCVLTQRRPSGPRQATRGAGRIVTQSHSTVAAAASSPSPPSSSSTSPSTSRSSDA
eukprot:scaffold99650_cov62-Phaeocystis_antarctica.AAC.1